MKFSHNSFLQNSLRMKPTFTVEQEGDLFYIAQCYPNDYTKRLPQFKFTTQEPAIRAVKILNDDARRHNIKATLES